jgi:hypothetical protein
MIPPAGIHLGVPGFDIVEHLLAIHHKNFF